MFGISSVKGSVYIFLAAFCWSLIGPFSSLVMLEDISPLEVSFWRCFLSGTLFFIFNVIGQQKFSYSLKDIPFLLGWVILGVGLNFVAYAQAVFHLGNGLASILLYTAPLWIMLINILIFKEFPSVLQILALLIGLAGIIIICWPHNQVQISFISLIWGILSGFGYGMQYFFNNSRLQKQPLLWNFTIIWLVASLLILPWVSFSPKSLIAWGNIACLCLISTIIAYCFWSLSLRYLSVIVASIMALCEPMLASLWGILFFDEKASRLIYMGSSLILMAAFLIVILPLMKKETL